MNFPRTIIATFALAILSAPVFAAKINVCHKSDEGSHTIRISQKAEKAHLAHGDSLGECPVVPVYKSVIMVRCQIDEPEGGPITVTVSGSSISFNAVYPVGLNLTPGASCSDAIAHLMNNGYSLDQSNSGGTALGLETEYLFIGESEVPVVPK